MPEISYTRILIYARDFKNCARNSFKYAPVS